MWHSLNICWISYDYSNNKHIEIWSCGAGRKPWNMGKCIVNNLYSTRKNTKKCWTNGTYISWFWDKKRGHINRVKFHLTPAQSMFVLILRQRIRHLHDKCFNTCVFFIFIVKCCAVCFNPCCDWNYSRSCVCGVLRIFHRNRKIRIKGWKQCQSDSKRLWFQHIFAFFF